MKFNNKQTPKEVSTSLFNKTFNYIIEEGFKLSNKQQKKEKEALTVKELIDIIDHTDEDDHSAKVVFYDADGKERSVTNIKSKQGTGYIILTTEENPGYCMDTGEILQRLVRLLNNAGIVPLVTKVTFPKSSTEPKKLRYATYAEYDESFGRLVIS